MKNYICILILIISFGLIACNSKEKKKDNQVKNMEVKALIDSINTKINSSDYFKEILQSIPLKKTPVIDTTNFNNIDEIKGFVEKDIQILQLHEIYPNLDKEGYNYRFLPSYRLELSDEFYTIILNVFKGDNELETILIIYDSDHKLSQYYNEEGKLITNYLVIAYDEIAEGWSRKFSRIENSIVTSIDEFYGETKQVDTTKFRINRDGYIKEVESKFRSSLRPNETILLNTIYTDTIEFKNYNDGGDYALLYGEKDKKEVVLLYNMEWATNEKYNFKYGDLIKVNWKMDSIYLAGDGETLDFKEKAIDAEHILLKDKEVKFLWRTDKFDKELDETFNSIVVNQAYVNSISNQEKAALGYVATFIGNECKWDGPVNEDRSNLKCEILNALDLGYQCSDKHLGFLRNWFSKDVVALKKLETCVTMPYTATMQTTFDEILITSNSNHNKIVVSYKVIGINMRESETSSWIQKDTFEYNSENITLINSQKSYLINENQENGDQHNKTINYFEFTPSIITNFNLNNFDVDYAYQLGSKKIAAGYDKKADPNTDEDWGDKLLLLNNKNNILFQSDGVGDVYLFEPHFYKNIETNKIIIICQLGYEYYFGGKAFVFENGEITSIGTLDIEGDNPEKSLVDIVQINEKDNELVFTFQSDFLKLEPGLKDVLIKNIGVKYIYKNKQLVLSK